MAAARPRRARVAPTQALWTENKARLGANAGYRDEWLEGLPKPTIASFAGVANPFHWGLPRPGEQVVEHGVTLIGPINLASSVPYHASQMYAKNVATFLLLLVKDGKLQLNMQDEIIRETMIARGGEIVNPRVREFFRLPALAPAGG